MALITQADLEKHLQIVFGNPTDPVVADLILQAESAADVYCKQPLEHAVTTDYSTEVDQSEPWLVLPNHPVSDVTTVTEDTTALVDGTDFRWYPDGRIRRLSGSDEQSWTRRIDGVVITYASGYGAGATSPYDTVPDGLKLALVTICGNLFRYGATYAAQGAVPIKTVALDGSDSITYAVVDGVPDPTVFPSSVKQLLSPYVRRTM